MGKDRDFRFRLTLNGPVGGNCTLKVSPSDDNGQPIALGEGGVLDLSNDYLANAAYPASGLTVAAVNNTGGVITAVGLETASGAVIDGAREHDQLQRSGILNQGECRTFPSDFCSPLYLARPVLPGEILAMDAHFETGIPMTDPQLTVTPQTGPYGDPLADLTIFLDYHDMFLAGSTPVTFNYLISNDGPEQATGTQFSVLIDGDHNFDSVTSGQGSCSRTSVAGGSLISCGLGSIAMGTSVAVDIQVTPPAGVNGHLTLNATTTGNQVDPDTGANLKNSQVLDVVERTDLDPNQSFSNDLDGDGIHDRITVGTKDATLAGTDDIDNDPKDKEVIVEDPNLDPNTSAAYDLDGDGDPDVIRVGTKDVSNAGSANIDNDPNDQEIILHDPNLDPNQSVGYDLDGDGDPDVIILGTKNTTDVGSAGNYAADDKDQEIPVFDSSLGPDQKIGYDLDGDGDSDIILHGSNGPGSPSSSSCATGHVLVYDTPTANTSVAAVYRLQAGYGFIVDDEVSVDLHTTPGGSISLYPGFQVMQGGSLSADTSMGPCPL